jgi:hypothetical protein
MEEQLPRALSWPEALVLYGFPSGRAVQFKIGEVCRVCQKAILSRYNGTRVCGACRVRLCREGREAEAAAGKGKKGGGGRVYLTRVLVKFPKRAPLRRPT